MIRFTYLLLPAMSPPLMVQALSAFMDFCYLVWCNLFDELTLNAIDVAVTKFHAYRIIFENVSICNHFFATTSALRKALLTFNSDVWCPEWSLLINHGIEAYQSGQRTLPMFQPF